MRLCVPLLQIANSAVRTAPSALFNFSNRFDYLPREIAPISHQIYFVGLVHCFLIHFWICVSIFVYVCVCSESLEIRIINYRRAKAGYLSAAVLVPTPRINSPTTTT